MLIIIIFPRCRCDGKSKCVVSVDSTSFHDACPGTLKYLEIHYACSSRSQSVIPSSNTDNGKAKPALPPWLSKQDPSSPVNKGLTNNNNNREKVDRTQNRRKPKGPSAKIEKKGRVTTKNGNTEEAATVVRKVPILVTERATIDSEPERRVPITTPRPTTSKTTTKATSSTTSRAPVIINTNAVIDKFGGKKDDVLKKVQDKTGVRKTIRKPTFPPPRQEISTSGIVIIILPIQTKMKISSILEKSDSNNIISLTVP